jgi:hypothetical protein
MHPDDDSMEYRDNQPRQHSRRQSDRDQQNGTCVEHQATREHFQAIENSLGRINDSLNKIDKDLIATISAGKVKSGVIASSLAIILLFGGYWVSEFRELKSSVAKGMEIRINNQARLEAVEGDVKDIRGDILRFQSKWEAAEATVHGTGIELHQYPVLRKK